MLTVRRTAQRVQKRYIDADGKKTKIVVSDYASGSPGLRTLPLSTELAERMKPFCGRKGYVAAEQPDRLTEPRTLENRLKHFGGECGVDALTFISLRDTYAVKKLAGGMDLKTLSVRLGHSCAGVTERRYNTYLKKRE